MSSSRCRRRQGTRSTLFGRVKWRRFGRNSRNCPLIGYVQPPREGGIVCAGPGVDGRRRREEEGSSRVKKEERRDFFALKVSHLQGRRRRLSPSSWRTSVARVREGCGRESFFPLLR